MEKLTLSAMIIGGKIEYENKNWREKVEAFKKSNEGKLIHLQFDNADSPSFFLHKYYRGYLLPDLATAYGEADQEYVHRYFLKKDFLFIAIDKLDDIPSKHKDRPTIYIKEIDGKVVVQGYAPSTGDITHQEMKEFILKCEHRLFVDMAGHIGMSITDPDKLKGYSGEAADYRQKGMDQVASKSIEDKFGDQAELFE
jgi:hypothetical protein